MKFGIQINPYYVGPTGSPWPAVAEVAQLADRTGFDSVWLYDHLLYEGGYSGHPYSEPVMECFMTLAAIAAITKNVKLGQLVLGMPYRNPALMTKMATTLDHISNGRTILGIGAGWHKREHEAYGFGELEDVPIRMKRLEEGVRVVKTLWTEKPANFSGTFYSLKDVKENPPPVQKPHPPIMIGGSGEKVTLRLVAQYAQYCNVSGDLEAVTRRFGILREHCERLGRPYEEITKTIYQSMIIGRDEADVAAKTERLAPWIPRNGALIGTPDQIIEQLRAFAAVGTQYLIFRMADWNEVESVKLFAETVIPALANV